MNIGVDKRYVKNTYLQFKRLGGEKLFFNNLVILGYENLAKEGQRLEIANHVSHADYMMRWWASQSNDLEVPIIPAGINLNSPVLRAIGLDFSKLCGFWVDRNLLKSNKAGFFSHARQLYQIFPKIIDSGKSTMVFAEGGRNEGEVMSRFEPAGVRSIIHAGKDIGLSCIAFDYDCRVEGWLINRIRARRDKRDFWYKFMDFSTFALRPIIKQFKDVGNAYMNVSPVVRLNEIAQGKTLVEKVDSVIKYSSEKVRELYEEIQEVKRKPVR